MKRILTITVALLATMVLYSCGDDCPDPEECDVPILFQVNPNVLTFGYNDKDSQPIFVTTMNAAWTAEVEASAQSWLKITEESDRVSVRVEENDTERNRMGTITITPQSEALNPVVVTVTQTLTETIRIPMQMAIWAFRGDPRESGYADHVITLGGGEGYFDEETRTIIMAEGYALILELLTEEMTRQDYQIIEVKTGSFKSAMDPGDPDFKYEQWSFLQTIQDNDVGSVYYNGSWILYFSDGYCTDQIVLTGGQVTVEGMPGNYHVVADLVTNRNERIVMEYTGPFDDIRSSASISSYTGDREINKLSVGGDLNYWGEELYNPGTYAWTVYLATTELTSKIEFDTWPYSPQTDSLVLESGDYTIQMTEPLTEFTTKAGYMLLGIWPAATWIYEYNEDGALVDYAPLIEGTVSITHNGENNYTFTVDALMDNYWKLTASFEGDLTYTNKASTSTGADFKGVPYKMENRERPAANIPDQSKRSVRYGLNID